MVCMIVLLLPPMACAGGVPYSAIVLDISGKATATHQGKSRSLEPGALLNPDEVVETAPGASLTINYLESEEVNWAPSSISKARTFSSGLSWAMPR
jgi:hypothetical protein